MREPSTLRSRTGGVSCIRSRTGLPVRVRGFTRRARVAAHLCTLGGVPSWLAFANRQSPCEEAVECMRQEGLDAGELGGLGTAQAEGGGTW